MRLPLHAVRMWPDAPRPAAPLAALQQALDGPLFRLQEAQDVLGMPIGFDIVVQDGAYVLLLAVIAWSFLRSWLRHDSSAQ